MKRNILNRRRPNGFYQMVFDLLPGVKFSRGLISMVKRGQRVNDMVLLAIITADHNLTHDKQKIKCPELPQIEGFKK
jgi:hypothetical protein